MSERLDAMVSDHVERTYLGRIDGFWADVVLAEFSFLEERGGTIKSLAFHQKGDYIHYEGPWGSVILEFMPDNYPSTWIHAEAAIRGGSGTFEGDLDGLLRERASPLPRSATLDRRAVAARVRSWANALRSATDLF